MLSSLAAGSMAPGACFCDWSLVRCTVLHIGFLRVVALKWKRGVLKWLCCKRACVATRLMGFLWDLLRLVVLGVVPVGVVAAASSFCDFTAAFNASASPSLARPMSRKQHALVLPVTHIARACLLAVYQPTLNTVSQPCLIAPFKLKGSFVPLQACSVWYGPGARQMTLRRQRAAQWYLAQAIATGQHSGMHITLGGAIVSLVSAVLCLEKRAPLRMPPHAEKLLHDLETRAAVAWTARASAPLPSPQYVPAIPGQSVLLQEAHASPVALPRALYKAEGGSAAPDAYAFDRILRVTDCAAQFTGLLVSRKWRRGVVKWLCCKRAFVDPRLCVAPDGVLVSASCDSADAPLAAAVPTLVTDRRGQIVPLHTRQVRLLWCRAW